MLDLGGVLLHEAERNLGQVLPPHIVQGTSDTRIFMRMFEFLYYVTGTDCKRAWFMGTLSSTQVVALVHQHIDREEHRSFFKYEQERVLIKHGTEYVILPEHIVELTHIDQQGLEFVKRCKAHGIRVMILSNWDPASFDLLKAKRSELFSLLDEKDLFIPTRTGFMKPDLQVFAYVTEHAQVDPQECFFIDDSAANAHAGSQVGLQAVHHQDWQTTIQELKKRGLEVS